ncbi:response regulator receiver protein [Gluconacetobacter diazotrophicus PA1 5]|uniref:Putative two-component response regulator n=1 Tax=Gluconacetobacter diazotrophicus (strain ATCC 49037 / DSM 5601 / CCUG 37298 / CIP 103539 / LMG 7603 / PAl5) TaxID=272568 RepID=A9H2T6_GLUDA|nr:response regulator [Gluconacetobacter diazotrophicus]ACI52075.1 response regulator receiver protein [Gluconacetobacter diazotrophicus PA1 5]TWB03053.1 response regulator receiver domain-containing protein [Gluconacetobacter diazotrophicus]CAP54199.1 putative two-component response regulator [Gluconacetobacter diazotrophicus PA1 5]
MARYSPHIPPRIVIAEDEVLTRLAVATELRDNGFEVREASNAEEALTVLECTTTHIDALFTDIDMPGSMNGLELALRARQSRPRLGVLVTSGKHMISDDFVLTRSRFVPKPYDISEIPRILNDLIEP